VPLFEYQSGVSSCSCDPRSRAANCAVAVIVVAMWEQVSILWYRRYPARAIAPSKSRLMKVQSGTTWERALRIRSLIRLGGSEMSREVSRETMRTAEAANRGIAAGRIDRIDHTSMMSLWQTCSCDSSFPVRSSRTRLPIIIISVTNYRSCYRAALSTFAPYIRSA